MKKLLGGIAAFVLLSAGAPAIAADAPVKAPVYKVAALVFDWTGFYLGGYVGVGVNRSRASDPTGVTDGEINFLGTGFTGGATAGYNLQFGRNWVAGIEGDIGYLGLSHRFREFNDELNLITDSKTSWLATLRGRIGYSHGPSLSYFTGGAAWVHFEDVHDAPAIVGGTSVTSSRTKAGYAVGSGVETMLGGGWTAKSEFLVVDVGRGDTLVNPDSGFTLRTSRHRYDMQRFGLNYQFGRTPQPMLPAGNWNGFYAGLVGGSAVVQAKAVGGPLNGTGGEFGNNGDGFTLGGMAGYNWQFAPAWVAGVEGDFSWLGINHSLEDFNDTGSLFSVKTRWIATLRGRVGYSTGPALLYVTGGAAWVNLKETWDFFAGPASSSHTLSGYGVGGGIEVGLAGNWTSKTEYLFVDVGNGNTLVAQGGNDIIAKYQFHLFRTGLTYRFGG